MEQHRTRGGPDKLRYFKGFWRTIDHATRTIPSDGDMVPIGKLEALNIPTLRCRKCGRWRFTSVYDHRHCRVGVCFATVENDAGDECFHLPDLVQYTMRVGQCTTCERFFNRDGRRTPRLHCSAECMPPERLAEPTPCRRFGCTKIVQYRDGYFAKIAGGWRKCSVATRRAYNVCWNMIPWYKTSFFCSPKCAHAQAKSNLDDNADYNSDSEVEDDKDELVADGDTVKSDTVEPTKEDPKPTDSFTCSEVKSQWPSLCVASQEYY